MCFSFTYLLTYLLTIASKSSKPNTHIVAYRQVTHTFSTPHTRPFHNNRGDLVPKTNYYSIQLLQLSVAAFTNIFLCSSNITWKPQWDDIIVLPFRRNTVATHTHASNWEFIYYHSLTNLRVWYTDN